MKNKKLIIVVFLVLLTACASVINQTEPSTPAIQPTGTSFPSATSTLILTSTATAVPTLTKTPFVIPTSLEQGLAAYYPFNGNANDMSGHGYNGIVNGAKLSADRFGNPDAAYSFDGFGDFIEIPDIGSYKQLTESIWVYYTDSSPSLRVLNNHKGWESNYLHFEIWDGQVEFSINGSGDQVSDFRFTSRTLNQWHHIAAIYDSTTTSTYFYIDGELDATRSHNFSGAVTVGPAWIGGWDGQPRWFQGYLDDIRIYSRVLSTLEIQALYYQGQ